MDSPNQFELPYVSCYHGDDSGGWKFRIKNKVFDYFCGNRLSAAKIQPTPRFANFLTITFNRTIARTAFRSP